MQELRIGKQGNQEQSNRILSDSDHRIASSYVFVYKTEIKNNGPILQIFEGRVRKIYISGRVTE